jgi:hypothetical protein
MARGSVEQKKRDSEWDLVRAFFRERNVTIATSTIIAGTESSIHHIGKWEVTSLDGGQL